MELSITPQDGDNIKLSHSTQRNSNVVATDALYLEATFWRNECRRRYELIGVPSYQATSADPIISRIEKHIDRLSACSEGDAPKLSAEITQMLWDVATQAAKIPSAVSASRLR